MVIARADVSQNVAELLVGKIESLNNDTQKVLLYAACVGHTFDPRLLAEIFQELGVRNVDLPIGGDTLSNADVKKNTAKGNIYKVLNPGRANST